ALQPFEKISGMQGECSDFACELELDARNGIPSMLTTASHFPNCKKLSILNGEVLDVTAVRVIEKCPKLTSLNLERCRLLSPVSFQNIVDRCPKLESLNLSNCILITDACLKYLGSKCPLLRSLDLTSCYSITNDGIKDLPRTCPDLAVLVL